MAAATRPGTPSDDGARHSDTPAFDQELLLWLGDESPSVRAADAERVHDIAAEFAKGFAALSSVTRAVTMFGSARTVPDSPDYARVREVASALGRAGYAIITGGGPGLMEAANRGARDAGALSIGCNIELPREQQLNAYVDIGLEFRHFFARKVMFVRHELDGLLEWLHDRALADGRISADDLGLLVRADGPAEVLEHVQEGHRRQRAQVAMPRREMGP